MTRTTIVLCPTCGNETPDYEVWAEEYCQMCWERYCSGTWWEMINSLSEVANEIGL